MDISNLSSTLASNSAAESLAHRSQDAKSVAEQEDIGKQVESVFASMLIKTMRDTLGEEGLFPGDKSDALGGLFDQYMGEQIVQGRGLGIGDLVAKYAHRGSEEQ